MKKFALLCLICVIFLLVFSNIGITYCFENEHIEFFHNGRFFIYSLEKNIKTSDVFDINFEINKYNRFGSTEERIKLLKKMLDLGFEKSVALDYLFPNLTKKISSIEKNIYVDAKNATLSTDTNSERVFNITKERVGRELDKQKLIV